MISGENKRTKFTFIKRREHCTFNLEQAVRMEVLNYFNCPAAEDETDLSQLESYIRKLFIKFDAILPSSAPVERIFSFAKMILRPQRQRLSPIMFEKLLVLKNRGMNGK